MSKIQNKIEANDRTIFEVLDSKKYSVDYFQREYSWQQKHIEQLVTDLTSSFLLEYDSSHERAEVENYNSYYLGPFVLSKRDANRSIIDGQQRLTSLTLFLIYLNNLQQSLDVTESVASMIFSEKFGNKSFNIVVEERIPCLKSLFEHGQYTAKEGDDESTHNMAARYEDIETAFPKEIDAKVLPFFIDWVKERVVLVEIVAYSDDNAYTIFETMNDRGLNLTPTEMLKGFLLSRFKDDALRQKANEHWKASIQSLHAFDKDEDQRFFQAWLRAKYAETIRPGSAGSKNEDFEKIGTRFHSWVRDNILVMGLESATQNDFSVFVNEDFSFYRDSYIKIRKAEAVFNNELEHVYYIHRWGIASSLSYPLLLAPLVKTDDAETVNMKINLVAKYIETFVVRRSVNFKKFSSSSIRYTMYSLVKEIRGDSLKSLESKLALKLLSMDQQWTGMDKFRLHRQNRRFVKFILSRISAYIDNESGVSGKDAFVTYYHNSGAKPFEVEHIWADKYDEHKSEFDEKWDFDEYRNRIGALVLLPNGSNQSYGAKKYEDKLPHYVKENLLVKTLCKITYSSNPNFIKMKERLNLPFEAHDVFNKADITKRQELYREICEKIWRWDVEVTGLDTPKLEETAA